MNYFKPWEELTIQDNFIFQHVMRNPEICKGFLEKLLNFTIKRVNYLQPEMTVAPRVESKSIRFDLYVEDERGIAYDVEMQTTNSASTLAKRTRYYQSAMDTDTLKRGDDYAELKDSFIIFVCTFDPFDKGLYAYTFRNRCVESDGLELNDGATKIFLNSKGMTGNLNDDIKNFLMYIGGQSPVGNFVNLVATEVDKVKRQDILRVEYMKINADIMDARREARIEGHAEGRIEGLVEGIATGLVKGRAEIILDVAKTLLRKNFPKEEIMEIAKCTQEQFLQAKRELDAES